MVHWRFTVLLGHRRKSDDENSDDGEFSESEEEEPEPSPPKRKVAAHSKKLDFSIDNNGLRFLPKMQYFGPGTDCPLTPFNKIEQDALTVIIQMPNG
jgi:hypothetical protein